MSTIARDFVLRDERAAQSLWVFLKANWKAMAAQGRPLAVSAKEHKTKRTIEQNARLHAILADIANGAWVNGRQYDTETWKEFFRQKFIGTEEIEMPDGRRIERGISTTTLDVHDFGAFMDQIEAYAVSELGMHFAL